MSPTEDLKDRQALAVSRRRRPRCCKWPAKAGSSLSLRNECNAKRCIEARFCVVPLETAQSRTRNTEEHAMGIRLKVNGRDRIVDVDPETPLLWVLRDALGLTGSTYACDIARCGACTVHL